MFMTVFNKFLLSVAVFIVSFLSINYVSFSRVNDFVMPICKSLPQEEFNSIGIFYFDTWYCTGLYWFLLFSPLFACFISFAFALFYGYKLLKK